MSEQDTPEREKYDRLERMPLMSVVLDNDGFAWQRHESGWRCTQQDLDKPHDADDLYGGYGISAFIHEPQP